MLNFVSQANTIWKTDFLLTFLEMNLETTAKVKAEFKKFTDYIKLMQK